MIENAETIAEVFCCLKAVIIIIYVCFVWSEVGKLPLQIGWRRWWLRKKI